VAKSIEQQLEDLANRLAPDVRRAFLAAIQDIQSNVTLTDLIDAIERNDYQRAYQLLGVSNASLSPLIGSLETAFGAGGEIVGASFPARLPTDFGRVKFRFDIRNPNAERFLKEQSGSLITRIQEDTRVNVRNVMQLGLENGINPRQTALDIVGRIDPSTGKRTGSLIGLTQQQEFWVRNARRDLEQLSEIYFTRTRRDKRFDSIVRKAIDSGQPLTRETIDKLISRYKDSLLKYRGDAIARTETIQALNRSQFEAINQAIELGATKRADVYKEWDTAGDDRVRETHREMDGQRVRIDEPFTTPDGYKLMYPGDISMNAPASEIVHCRCRIKMKIDWLADLD
jgi:hypothetical protein